jgi:hypothetical protein
MNSGLRGRSRPYPTILESADHVLLKNGKICPPATSEAGVIHLPSGNTFGGNWKIISIVALYKNPYLATLIIKWI